MAIYVSFSYADGQSEAPRKPRVAKMSEALVLLHPSALDLLCKRLGASDVTLANNFIILKKSP